MEIVKNFFNSEFLSEEYPEDRAIHLKLLMFIIPLLISIIFWDFYELNAKFDMYYVAVKGSLIGSLTYIAYRNYKKQIYLKYLYWSLYLLFIYSYYGLVYIHFTYFYSFWEMYFVISFFFKITKKAYLLLVSFGVVLNYLAIKFVTEPEFIKIGYSYKPHMILVTIIVIFLTALLFFNVTKKYEELNMLQRKFAQIGKQSSFVLHEIQKPLNRLIKQESQKSDDLKKVSNIILNIELMLNKPNEFKNSFEKLDLAEVFYEVRSDLIDFINEYKINFEIHIEKLMFEGNKGLLFQVFKNLSVNAIEALEKDVSLSNKYIKIYSDYNEDRIILKIINSKSNSNLRLDSSIFNPFVTTKDSSTNKGLGLSFCKNIIEGHNGIISVKNHEYETEIEIRFKV